jgi:hypothetical protein
MLDNIRPYKMIFIQKASPNVGDAFDFAYIYKFYSNRKDICQRLKYIVRVEVTNDIFAIKFYAARDKSSIINITEFSKCTTIQKLYVYL